MKKNVRWIAGLIFLLTAGVLQAQPVRVATTNTTTTFTTGFIYLHKKAMDEGSSVHFTYSLTGGSTQPGTLTLNDKPDIIDAYDLGASHGGNGSTAGKGQLWAVTAGDNTGKPHAKEGLIYLRSSATGNWTSTGQTGQSVDGAEYNTMVYTNSAGNAYFYTVGGSANRIYNPANHSNNKLRDIAYGDNMTVVVDERGHVLKYTGTYANNNDSWTDLTNFITTNGDNVYVVDVVPSSNKIILQDKNGTVYTMTSTGGSFTALPFPANASAPETPDVAVDENGKIYAGFKSTARDDEGYIFAFNNNSWAIEIQTRELSGSTGGVAGQMWAINVLGGTARNSIYSRTTEGGANWIDDERVRTTVPDNSMMIPVIPGTYTLTESVPSGWHINKIEVYDPSNNSVTDPANRKVTIKVTDGEVVHVVFTNEKVQTTALDNTCGLQYIEDFGSGDADFAPARTGTTTYHYVADKEPQDGYYTLEKDALTWFTPGSEVAADHTPNTRDGGKGYMMTVNASYATDEFYRHRVTGLTVGQEYQLGFWAANISPTRTLKPNITFGVADVSSGDLLNSISTGEINFTNWHQYTFKFTATSTSVDLTIRNNGIGGAGNDLVLDDITFNVAPPAIATINGPAVACSNTSSTYSYSNTTPGGVWSVSPTTSASISASGVLTPVTNATGVVTISYIVTNSSNCVSTATKQITLDKNCAVAPVSISGNVFNDVNGLTNSTIDGAGTNAGGINVIVYNTTTGKIQAIMAVPSSGVYSFSGLPSGNNYSIVLTTNTATAGATAALPTVALPAGWVTIGENVGTSAGNDGTPNSILVIGVLSSNVSNANFGIEQLPTAGSGANTVSNAGGTTPVTVPPSTFTNTAASTDVAPGTVTSIRITAFPTNTTSLTINGTVYTASSPVFSGGNPTGVIVPTNGSGMPTVTIKVDPANDANAVDIPFKAIDNANKESTNTGHAVLNFTANVPDLTPIISARPAVIYNTTSIAVVVDVYELKSVNTSGQITVRISKDDIFTLNFLQNETTVNGRTVMNSDWTFDATNSSYYQLTTNKVINGGSVLSFGLTGTLTPGQTKGKVTLSAVILGNSGGEIRNDNNNDADSIDYFPTR